MNRQDIQAVVDYIARNHKCTFPSAWDTGDGVEAGPTFSKPLPSHVPEARRRRDALVYQIERNLAKSPSSTSDQVYIEARLIQWGSNVAKIEIDIGHEHLGVIVPASIVRSFPVPTLGPEARSEPEKGPGDSVLTFEGFPILTFEGFRKRMLALLPESVDLEKAEQLAEDLWIGARRAGRAASKAVLDTEPDPGHTPCMSSTTSQEKAK